MIFAKAVAAGIVAVVLMWIAILSVEMLRSSGMAKRSGELIAVSGGWAYLLRLPLVVVLLTAAFGIGLSLAVRK
jgi:hypothetical protein